MSLTRSRNWVGKTINHPLSSGSSASGSCGNQRILGMSGLSLFLEQINIQWSEEKQPSLEDRCARRNVCIILDPFSTDPVLIWNPSLSFLFKAQLLLNEIGTVNMWDRTNVAPNSFSSVGLAEQLQAIGQSSVSDRLSAQQRFNMRGLRDLHWLILVIISQMMYFKGLKSYTKRLKIMASRTQRNVFTVAFPDQGPTFCGSKTCGPLFAVWWKGNEGRIPQVSTGNQEKTTQHTWFAIVTSKKVKILRSNFHHPLWRTHRTLVKKEQWSFIQFLHFDVHWTPKQNAFVNGQTVQVFKFFRSSVFSDGSALVACALTLY